MPRKLFRFLDWTLTPDREPDAQPIQHMYRCLAEDEDGKPCGAEGPVHEDFKDAQKWPFEHIKEEQAHRSYAHVAVVPWLMVPREEPS
ncbi:DUF7848 domain-containing protein [Kitasatospora sp. NPDC001175]|uniref:DUF7848 domain-containing protein n=1 Tax=Kitasatospora sp. NPDC001175 TaxID=3157103 RepID=UPI003D05263A